MNKRVWITALLAAAAAYVAANKQGYPAGDLDEGWL
jgi:hypothetical protein